MNNDIKVNQIWKTKNHYPSRPLNSYKVYSDDYIYYIVLEICDPAPLSQVIFVKLKSLTFPESPILRISITAMTGFELVDEAIE